jgi:hypothetical protein
VTPKLRAWPFPGDSVIARARKIALAYRETAKDYETAIAELYEIIARVDPRVVEWVDDEQFKALHKLATEDRLVKLTRPAAVADMDQRFYDWGETWHANFVRTYDDDEWINSKEASAILLIDRGTINALRNRGRLNGQMIKREGDHTAKWYFLAGDIYRLAAERRTRGSQKPDTTDKVQTDGESDAE